VVRHTGGSETLYGHLEAGSIDLANQQQIPYPKTPGAPPYVLPDPIRVNGGISVLGIKDTTGGATGPHLHFEYSTGYIFGHGRTDPQPCITLPPPTPNPTPTPTPTSTSTPTPAATATPTAVGYNLCCELNSTCCIPWTPCCPCPCDSGCPCP
jgi:hypothetical protein